MEGPPIHEFYEETKKAYPAFEMVGIEVQYSGTEVIQDHIDFYGMHYPVAERGSFDGYRGVVLPVCVVFDHQGKLLMHKRIFDKKVRAVILEALEKAPHPLLGPREYVRLAGEAERVKAGKALGRVLARVRAIWSDHDAEPGLWDEAYTLFSRLDNHAEKRLCEAELLAEENPVLGFRAYHEVSRVFEGDDRGRQAKEAGQLLSSDPGFVREEAGWILWEAVRPLYEKHRFRITRVNRVLLERVNKLCADFEGTAAGDLAVDLRPDLREALRNRE